MQILSAFKAFFRILSDADFARQVDELDRQTTAASLAILVALQREGRMIDFLLEDIANLDDDQVGAAAKEIQRKCQKVIKDFVVVAPVRDEREGSKITVEDGFDPSAVRLVGKVAGDPPFKGVLTHHGWKAKEVRISPIPPGQDPTIITPAEVEIR
ncbi:MAG: DUF2760 domain-containing protein [Candidatus Wallbacteria bacterium]|nr:DUF2760 domain-containing protein [Candidatus Wallbacteria bacterium]